MNISFIPALICSLSYADGADAYTPFYDCESSVLIVSDSHSLIFPNLLTSMEEDAAAAVTPETPEPQQDNPQVAPPKEVPQKVDTPNEPQQQEADTTVATQNAPQQQEGDTKEADTKEAARNQETDKAPAAQTETQAKAAPTPKPQGPAQEFTRSSGAWASWLVSALAIGVAVSLLYYARKLQAGLAEGTTPPADTPPAPLDEEPSASECQMREMEAASNASTDENLKGLLLDRLEDIKLYAENTEKWAKEAVGLIDEIRVMRNAYSGTNGDVLDTISSILKTQMQDRNCEILDSDTWDPSIQRAIKINRILPKGSTPRVATKYTSGIKVEGNLIRKQEIELEQEVAE